MKNIDKLSGNIDNESIVNILSTSYIFNILS